jgi:transposase-like protein
MREKKGRPAEIEDRDARPRSKSARGRGTYDSGRPPVVGVQSRRTGALRAEVVPDTQQDTLEDALDGVLSDAEVVYTDEHAGYDWVASTGRTHRQVNHQEAYAVDQTGDGERTTHINTLESAWARFKTWLRRFHGVAKAYLGQYLAMFVQAENHDRMTAKLLQRMCGCASPDHQ